MKELFFAHIDNESAILSENEYHHAIRVTRHAVNDEIWVTDFKGKIWSAIIRYDNGKTAGLCLTNVIKEEIVKPRIGIAISPTQTAERTEWFVEKAVECGVNKIHLLQCKRTEVKRVNMPKLLKVMWGAAKQTHRAYLPDMIEMQAFDHFIRECQEAQRFICHCESAEIPYIGNLYSPEKDAIVCIGPAGDFTYEEIQLALQNGFLDANLGEFRLRTETAGLASLQILQTIRNIKL